MIGQSLRRHVSQIFLFLLMSICIVERPLLSFVVVHLKTSILWFVFLWKKVLFLLFIHSLVFFLLHRFCSVFNIKLCLSFCVVHLGFRRFVKFWCGILQQVRCCCCQLLRTFSQSTVKTPYLTYIFEALRITMFLFTICLSNIINFLLTFMFTLVLNHFCLDPWGNISKTVTQYFF